ncbi:MAG: hypothetical protein ABUT20_15605 [Bacteroidota bacterium]
MTTNLKMTTILLLVYLGSIGSRCSKTCTQHEYSFVINAKAFPDMDSIFINDTIWIELNEPTLLKDLQTGTYVNYSSAKNLSTAISFHELLGSGQFRNAAMDFESKLIQGIQVSNTNTSLLKEFQFLELNSNYIFKLGIVPKARGIYRIGLSNASNVFRRNDECSKATFTINFKETNQHLYFNEWNSGVIVPLPNGGYCFKVK